MRFAHFFISRPIFASVLSIVLVIVGGLALLELPIAQFPNIVPPTVIVSARYPGANPRVLAETVATPIEQEVNGVENMLYMSAQCAADGSMSLTITFKLGTDIDKAQVLVQNRVAVAEPRLPEEVRRIGVTTAKRSPDITMVVNMISPDNSFDKLFIDNYAYLQVRDALARVSGVGGVTVFGARDYSMRVWLDPEKVAANGLTAGDVIKALREQNVQVAAGVIGQQPMQKGVKYQFIINAQGRLSEEGEFGEVVIKTGDDGQVTRLRDVARIELAARDYSMDSKLNGQPNASLGIFQLPGSNSIETSDAIRATMEDLKKRFPPGLDYRIVFDTTTFTRESVRAVIETLVEAMILVVLVVVVFLQSWRASIIPLLAVPVSLIGTFGAMAALGFSLNNLSLFGLVLAIGIVVDDAIVVVENVERNIALGLSPLEATRKAMDEVSGAVVAVGLVLSAVFIPTAFISGITGQFYRQFALTIAISTLISAFNSLTLSPALCAILLKPHGAREDWMTRSLNLLFGWFFRGFNRLFSRSTELYARTVGRLIRFAVAAIVVYLGLLGLTYLGFKNVPSGFIPSQDKGYIAMMAQLPDAASLERTGEVVDRISKIARETPGVRATIDLAGLSPIGLSAAPNAGTLFVILDDFRARTKRGLTSEKIVADLRRRCSGVQEAFIGVFPPPAVQGLGLVGGFKMQVQDRGGAGLVALENSVKQLVGAAARNQSVQGVFSSYRATVPQLFLDVDRTKAKAMNVSLDDVFDTLQIYLGSLYVNDLNLFGRTYQVTAQADAPFRKEPGDIVQLKTRNAAGEMVPLGTLVAVKQITGPDKIVRYNMYPSAELTGNAAPGISSGDAIATMERLARETLPASMGFEWTELTLQEQLAGNTAIFIFPLCVLFVFLTLAALYESWSLPLAIILIVPMCLFSAIAGVWLRGMDNNIFTQIGFVVLVGLACKNAILIVEFAKQKQDAGLTRFEAAVEASRLRLRPILMTSFAFIFGVIPLVLATGAGAEMRRALGTAVFSGMLGVTLFGIFLTPVFYVAIRWATERRRRRAAPVAAGVVVALLLCQGCAVGPDFKAPETKSSARFLNDAAPQFSTNDTAVQWWRGFDDAQLEALVARALTNNHDLRIAAANLREARGLRRLNRFDFYPMVTASGGYTERLNSSAVFRDEAAAIDRGVELYDVGFDATWELDIFGRVRRSVEASTAELAAARATLRDVQISVISEVARNYMDLRGAQNQLAVARSNAENARETLRITEARLGAGRGTELDTARASAQMSSTYATIPPLETDVARAAHRLSVLVGEQPAVLAQSFTNATPLPAPPRVIAIGSPEALLRRRADIRIAEQRLAAATAQIGVATADLFPRVTFNGSVGLEAKNFSGLGATGSDTYSFGPRITWAALDLGRVRARIDAADARAQGALAAYERAVLNTLEETENALVTFAREEVRLEHLRNTVRASETAANLARLRFEAGGADFLAVLDAERVLLTARDQLAQAETRAANASISVYKALGGGWEAPANP